MVSAVPAAGPVLSVRDLVTEFRTPDGVVHAVDHVSFDVHPGETVGIVGESGSGKSVTALSVLGLVPEPPGRIVGGQVLLEGRDLRTLSPRQLRDVRGRRIAMTFQDPLSALNPVLTVGRQVAEAVRSHHRGLPAREVRRRCRELLAQVGMPDPAARLGQYPHELSGGMRQRVLIAMAVANQPALLVADEPTTALDVTIQAQVMEVLRSTQRQTGAATILITHDLGLIAEMADRVLVMYGGRVVETAEVTALFSAPRHPYTLGLLAGLPRPDVDAAVLAPIPGQPPSLIERPAGCIFHPRCTLSRGRERCRAEVPPLYPAGEEHRSACHFLDEVPAEARRLSVRLGPDGDGAGP